MKRQTKSLTILVLILLVAIIGMTAWYMVNRAIPNQKYQQAVALRDGGQYEDAIAAFADLGNYSDAETQIKETKYQQANNLMSAEKYGKAHAIYASISEYRDADDLLAQAAAALDAEFSIGNYVFFGTYPQSKDGNSKALIEWIVLDRDGDRALLVSRYALDKVVYNASRDDATWETCTLRAWLNKYFFNRAFDSAEQAVILTTTVDNSESQCYNEWNTNGGNNTQDKIFLLSYAEANKYFDVNTYYEAWWQNLDEISNMKPRVARTAYASAKCEMFFIQGYTTDGDVAATWWLRSPGSAQNTAACVLPIGALGCKYNPGDEAFLRPALWVDIHPLSLQ